MDEETFSRVVSYLGYNRDDKRSCLLHGLFVLGLTKSEAAKAFGFTSANAGLTADRALRDLRRAGDLTGVYIEPTIRRGTPGRKAAQ